MIVAFVVNNKDTDASDKTTFDRIDPVTGDVSSTAAAAKATDAQAVAKAAGAAFPAWSTTDPGQRRALLNRAADIMDAKSADFITTMIAESGATGPWAGFNVMLAAGVIREAAAMTTQIGGEVIPSNKPGTLAMGVATPKGVCLGIAPWNAPVILGTRAVAMPLACGNTVVVVP